MTEESAAVVPTELVAPATQEGLSPDRVTVEQLQVAVEHLTGQTEQAVLNLRNDVAELVNRFEAVRSYVKEKVQTSKQDDYDTCDPLMGMRPTVEQQMALFKALAEWQATYPVLIKDQTAHVESKRTGKTFSYAFADLGQATSLAHSTGQFGLSTFQITVPRFYRHGFVRAYLVHQGGGFIYCDAPIYPRSGEGDREGQNWAAGVTFARRYALCSVLGIAAAGDDDYNGPPEQPPGGRGITRPAERPAQPSRVIPARTSAPQTSQAATARPPAPSASVPSAGHSSAPPASPGWGNGPSGT